MASPEPRTVGAGLTHCGCLREANEDALLTDPEGLRWAVADGMGGYGHGDIAAGMAVAALARMDGGAAPAQALRAACAAANTEIYTHARRARIGLMGTTLVAAIVQGGVAHVAWVGDSRAYLWRAGALSRLTRDHSVVQELIDRGLVDPARAESHPQRHVVTRAVGVRPEVEVDYVAAGMGAGDRLLLCSDGLTACVDERTIAARLGRDAAPAEICAALVEDALEGGAPDNVSVVVVGMEQV